MTLESLHSMKRMQKSKEDIHIFSHCHDTDCKRHAVFICCMLAVLKTMNREYNIIHSSVNHKIETHKLIGIDISIN